MKTTLLSLADQIRTEADAYSFLESLRWPNGTTCPNCDSPDVYLIRPKNGISRKTRDGVQTQRRTWNCRTCRRQGRSPQFSATSGTVLHGTKVSVRIWVLVLFDMIAAKNGISAHEVARKYGLCPRSAWFVCHRIREAMRADDGADLFVGLVMADETYVGGDPENWHGSDQRHAGAGRGTHKTPVVSLLNAATGEVRSRVITDVTGITLGRFIMGNVDPTGGTLVTDQWKGYLPIGSFFAKHETVNHSQGEYVRNGYSTNAVESFYSQLKRSIDGTHHNVSSVHLHRYVAEHDFRRTTCKVSDAERLARVVEQADGRRLTYKRVKAS